MERVELFVSCMVDLFEPGTGVAAVRVLERRGASVRFPATQTCCGQFAYNAGYWVEAFSMASGFLEAFSGSDDRIVALSGSCAAMVIHAYPTLLEWAARDMSLARTAKRLTSLLAKTAPRVLDLSQWLDETDPVTPAPAAAHTLTLAFHTGCHMRRLLGIQGQPEAYLERLGHQVASLPDADQCCGFGGTYAMTEPEVSTALADAKLDGLATVRAAGAKALVSGDWGCLLHLRGRLARRGEPFPCVHLAQVVEWHDQGRLGEALAGELEAP